MSLADAERLRKIHTFPSLVKYLRDDLGWPIESNDFEEITFEYEPAELGLDPKTAVKVEKIMQLRPLTTNQPFGIFFLQFQPKRLPVVVLRRILQSLALKKRASANKADRAAWKKNDLLFISAHGEEQQRTITFAHFREDEYQPGDLPTLRVLGWDDRDTVLHLGDVHETLTRSLSWPRDEEDVDTWRQKWCSAFSLRHREVITTSKRLAVRLAELARVIRNRASAVLDVEDKRKGKEGPLTKLHRVFQTALIHDLSEDDFADMYAQTIAYGLLSARVSRPAGLVADNITDMVPVTNPFLKEMLEEFLHVGGRKKRGKTGLDFDELGVTEVVETLRSIDMQAVLRDFGDRNPQEDPVIHFYELFLKEYDAKKRMQRGVFYTPRPVVSYIVRSVHELLQTEFGLEDGLADTTTWAEMIKRFPAKPAENGQDAEEGLKIPEGTPPGQAFVQILDPATGTGTFLVETIDVIHKTMVSKWKAQRHNAEKIAELWNDYVPKHLLPRIHGYEIMMAPYAIAHMKIGLKLYETGYRFQSGERARIYLTNTLEPPQDFSGHFDFDIPALAHEAEAVNEIKRKQRFTVVIGNPPYSGISSNMTPWIGGLLKGTMPDGTSSASYYHVDGQPLGERKLWLQDDYVKFIRWSQYCLTSTGVGIHGYISNHGYLDNPTFRGMRWSLMDAFDDIRVLDLHGNLKKKETPPGGGKDVNVFDIQQGVGIGLFVRRPAHSPGIDATTVRHADLWGDRDVKYRWLLEHSAASSDWQDIPTAEPFFLFEPFDQSKAGDYKDWPAINNVMPVNVTGIVTARDDFVIDFDRAALKQRMTDLRDSALSDQAIRQKYFAGKGAKKYPPGDSRGWKLPMARQRLRDDRQWDERYASILYRPFDIRDIYYVPWMVDWPRTEAMPHMLAGKNLAIGTTRTVEIGAGYSHIFATREMIQHHTISIKEVNYEFPLYLYPGVGKSDGLLFHTWPEGKEGRRPNLDPGFVEAIAEATGLTFVSDGRDDLARKFGPEDMLAYIYAVFHSPEYRRRFEPMLKLDFPRIPPPGAAEPFAALAQLGHDLLALHLLESPKLTKPITKFAGGRNPEVEKVSWSKNTVWIDTAQTIGFKSVPEQVWDFHIGGYQVCHKWLKDRKGRTLSDDDIAHYQKIVVALNETIRIMAEIDDVIDQHGGWPGAFQTGADRDDA